MKIERSLKQYKDIEKFQLYELTNNIAYEMGIRNSYVVELVNYIMSTERYIFEVKLSLMKIDDGLNKTTLNDLERDKHLRDREECLSVLKQCTSIYETTDEYLEILATDYLSSFPYNNYIHLEPILFDNEVDYDTLELVHHLEDFKNRNIIDMDKAKLDIKFHAESGENTVEAMLMSLADKANVKTFFDTNITHDLFELFPKFKRPYMKPPEDASKLINISVNLHLPENELLDYISYIKKTYEKDKELISIPIDLIDETDTSIYTISSKLKNASRSKTKQEIYADSFFIYDCIRNKEVLDIGNYKNVYDYINSELKYYYAELLALDDGLKSSECEPRRFARYLDMVSEMDKRTIDKRYTDLDKYIEGELYKQLLY